MPGSKSDMWEGEVLKMATGQATTTPVQSTAMATVYVGLFTATPSDAGGGTEVSGGAYARVDSKGKWGAPSGTTPTQVQNNAVITFPTASASWGTVSQFGIFLAISGGTPLMWGDLTASKLVGSGDTASFAVGALTLTED